MTFVCFVAGTIFAVLAALVGAGWIDTGADLLNWQALVGLSLMSFGLGFTLGTVPPVR